MLRSVVTFFQTYLSPSERDDSHAAQHKLQLASAALLLEICTADRNEDSIEAATLLNILKSRFHLSDDELQSLERLAREEVRDATSLYQFTALINEGFGREEKLQLLRQLWQIAYADGRLDRYEEHLIRKIADLLYLSHGDYIKAKLDVRAAGNT